MKGIDEKVWGIILAVIVGAILLAIGLALLGGTKESADPLGTFIKNLLGTLG